ncbi:MAG: hypothetical protein N0C84_01335 [Candidatus Thiodiazotropha taylori]|uniref:Uncharacterized protein n=1 Tax=Candidatus Thiodiazotropha taylori TaxID=2792791 RepID=A0A9E4K9I3_9GAMM|nr:hypothetical protein [Candidatus Thiodiazotropha taylori]MCW4255090.1 hypothetical protein [Candidatus Thiodiazotropha taylori]
MKLFTRVTTVSETNEGLQQARINVFIYDNEEIAYEYFKEWLSGSDWAKQRMLGEGFYTVKKDDYTNTIFLETRCIRDNPMDAKPGCCDDNGDR